jgi:galactonate dehydratase
MFIKIITDEGIHGWGEALGDKARVHAEAVRALEPQLIGEDPGRIVHLFQSMMRGAFWRGGPTLCAALSAVEIALWDIQGKRLGVPVYQLLGGPTRDRIRVYSHLHGSDPALLAKGAAEIKAKGHTALKLCPFNQTHPIDHYSHVQQAADRVAAIREAVGWDFDIMLDFHGRSTPAMSILMEEAMRPSRPFFIEEPVLPENADALARVAAQSKTPIATGERLFLKYGFREVLAKGACAIIQPDPCICGGILEATHIAAMADAHYVSVAPHNPYGPINLAAALHVDAVIPNFLIQEYIHLGEGYLKQPFVVKDGYIDLPTGPGLGIEVDEAYVASIPLGEQRDPGVWRHEDDGSVADW